MSAAHMDNFSGVDDCRCGGSWSIIAVELGPDLTMEVVLALAAILLSLRDMPAMATLISAWPGRDALAHRWPVVYFRQEICHMDTEVLQVGVAAEACSVCREMPCPAAYRARGGREGIVADRRCGTMAEVMGRTTMRAALAHGVAVQLDCPDVIEERNFAQVIQAAGG